MGDSVDDRFTSRLEAFSDLVFGFSLSFLATRLDVAAKINDIFDPGRWLVIIGTFALVCRFWLEHYRIFRHHFRAQTFDAVLNFVFLFAIAVLPYSLQTFLRFQGYLPSFTLYVGDFSLILVSLSALRIRSLRQRREDPDLEDRLREWRRSLIQVFVCFLLIGLLITLTIHGGAFEDGMRKFGNYAVLAFLLILILVRRMVRRLPGFLRG